jgi:benzoyl-CoA reductase subunit C
MPSVNCNSLDRGGTASRPIVDTAAPPPMRTSDIVSRCQTLFEDLTFAYARKWKAAAPERRVVGYMPFYVPRELIHAAGALPLGILGGSDQLEVIHGDAYYQSYICRIPRSTIELGIMERLDFVDAMLFPSICDVIRNLSGMWKIMFPRVKSRYFDVPQNYADDVGGAFYVHELADLRDLLGELRGRKIEDDEIRSSIALYNENRRLVRDVYAYRVKHPWQAPSSEIYLLMRAGMVLAVEDHNRLLGDYLESVATEERPRRDNARVLVTGAFCEQPPLNLIKSIELAGCYIVDDDFMLVNRWEQSDVAIDGDPLRNLSASYLHNSGNTSAKYEPDQAKKGLYLIEAVKRSAAEGVIFATPSFCDPALLERPMLQSILAAHGIPYIAFKYAENSGQMQPIREQAGTFADSIKLWSDQ